MPSTMLYLYEDFWILTEWIGCEYFFYNTWLEQISQNYMCFFLQNYNKITYLKRCIIKLQILHILVLQI
jgi:hypothetical protein